MTAELAGPRHVSVAEYLASEEAPLKSTSPWKEASIGWTKTNALSAIATNLVGLLGGATPRHRQLNGTAFWFFIGSRDAYEGQI